MIIRRKYIPLDKNFEYRVIYMKSSTQEALKILLVRKAFDEEGNIALIKTVSGVEFHGNKVTEFLNFIRELLKESVNQGE